MIPRDTYAHDPGRGVDRRRAVRSLARARRRRRGHRRGAQDRRRHHRPGAALQLEQPAGRVLEGILGLGAPTRASSRTRSPTRCTSSSAISTASRGPSSPSRPIATASGMKRHDRADRRIKEIYIADYDGANPRRITVNRSLNITPVWSADGKAIAYTSYRRNNPPTSSSRTSTRAAARDAGARHRPHPQLPAGVVARRHAHRVHDQPRRQPRDLRDESRRQQPAPHHPPSRRSTRRRPGRPPAIRSRSPPIAPARRRSTSSTPTGSASRGASRRSESWADRATWSPAPFNEIAYAARTGPGLRHQDLRRRQRRRDAADHQRRGQQREPGLLADRPPSRVHLDALGQAADLHHRPRRQRLAPGYEGRQQLHAELVALSRTGVERPETPHTMPRRHSTRLLVPRLARARHVPVERLRQEEAADRARPRRRRRKHDRHRVRRRRPSRWSSPRRSPVPPEPSVDRARHSAARSTRSTSSRRCSRSSSSSTAPR